VFLSEDHLFIKVLVVVAIRIKSIG